MGLLGGSAPVEAIDAGGRKPPPFWMAIMDVLPLQHPLPLPGLSLHPPPERSRSAGGALTTYRPQGTVVREQPARLSKRQLEKRSKEEMKKAANEELSRMWMYRDPEVKRRAKDYFETMKDPNWRLVSDSNGTQVWRLPGEKVHRIMGVSDVNKPPTLCMEYFKDPAQVFTRVFPRIDKMFVSGQVLTSDTSRGYSLCQALFRLPNPIGDGAARGFPARDMVWEQLVAKLPTGNVLVTAKSSAEKDAIVAPKTGTVRGEILTSGYYGRAIPTDRRQGGKGRCRVWYIVQADPKGILPKWLVNLAATKQAANVTRLSEMFKN